MNIRIGSGAGCSFDRIEPAENLVRYGDLDYIIFECLAERTMADNTLSMQKDASLGYTPMLRERMEAVLRPAMENNVKIITNMGGANIKEAVNIVLDIAQSKSLKNVKVGAVFGDDVKDSIGTYFDLQDRQIVAANVYLGVHGIIELLENDCDIIITGRIADASLFVAPILHDFNWNKNDYRIAQATLLGHLLECCGQVTGGYAADPGNKDIPNLENLGFPIAEIQEDGIFTISKLEDTGGEISERIVKEQLTYEIFDLNSYITPDAIIDFSQVDIQEIDKNIVKLDGAKLIGKPDNYKVNVSYFNGYIGIGEISYAGSNAINKARLCEDIIRKRISLLSLDYIDIRFDLVGYNSIFPENKDIKLKEARLRMTVRTEKFESCNKIVREMDYMYTNGPSGSSGIETRVKENLAIESCYIPINEVRIETKVYEVENET